MQSVSRVAPLMVVLLASAAIAAPAGSLPIEPALTWDDGVEPSRVVIHFVDAVPHPLPAYIAETGGNVVLTESFLPFVVVAVDPVDSLRLIEAAEADVRVAAAEHDRYVHAMYTPNDMIMTGTQAAVNLPDAWDITLGSHDVSLHILDTGVDHTHLDLLPNLSPMCDSPTSVGWSAYQVGVPGGQESGFHGTHVAGIASAVINNTLGVAGASQSCITSVRVLAVDTGLANWVAAGIKWSTDNGADIISMSLGASAGTYSLNWAVEYAEDHGVLVIAAAGNDDCGPVSYPAAYDEVIAVAALNTAGTAWASYSNCGSQVEVSAPGNAWSTLPGNTYGPLSGTSMATPLVAGIAGLLLAENSSLTNNEMRCILVETAVDLGPSGHDTKFGWGRVHAYDAVVAASNPSSVGC